MIFSDKFGFILETVISYSCKKFCGSCPNMSEKLTSHLPLHSNDENARGKKILDKPSDFFSFSEQQITFGILSDGPSYKTFFLVYFCFEAA